MKYSTKWLKARTTLPCLLVCLGACSLPFSSNAVVDTKIAPPTASSNHSVVAHKISHQDQALLRKLAISHHHALLEVNYKQGYVIADLTPHELDALSPFGFKVEVANQWNARYQDFLTKVNQAKSTKQKQIAGIPGFECYPTVEETLSTGADLANQYPSLSEWIDIGDSWQKVQSQGGYDLMVLKITNQAITQDKPKLFVHSAMHAREYAPAALNLEFAKQLLNEYDSNPDIRWIVDYHEVHLLFHMNPDGRKIAETGVLQRKNTNELHCPQGADDGVIGVDLNRNFAHTWNSTTNGSSGNECDNKYRGLAPESEPETKAVSDYIRSLYPDVRGPALEDPAPTDTAGMHIDIHSFSELVLWPWGHTNTPSANDAGFVSLGNKLAWFNNYTPQQSIGLYPTDGTSDSVSYGDLGIAAFTFELGTAFFQNCDDYNYVIKPDNLKALHYAAKATAAPYLLGHGPDFLHFRINGSEKSSSVAQGNLAELKVAASTQLTRQSNLTHTIESIEYSIDTPIWQDNAVVSTLTADDGNFDSGVESASVSIDTSNLTMGAHTVFLRAKNQDGQAGVTSAIDLHVSDNNSAVPSFTSSCSGLSCSFDPSASNDSDGDIIGYNWFYGDGFTASVATNQTQQYSYPQAGTYTVTLAITDDSQNRSYISADVKVTQPIAPPEEPERSSGGGSGSFVLLALLVGLIRISSRNANKLISKNTAL